MGNMPFCLFGTARDFRPTRISLSYHGRRLGPVQSSTARGGFLARLAVPFCCEYLFFIIIEFVIIIEFIIITEFIIIELILIFIEFIIMQLSSK